MGWLTVVGYFVACWLCLQAFQKEKRGPHRPYREAVPAVLRVLKKHWPNPPVRARRAALWLVMATVLLLLGINKQLDLQSLFTEIGRVAAHAQGWYEDRRGVQFAFIAVVALAGLVVVALFAWLARGALKDFRLPLTGMAFIVSFVVIRAASFHNVDELLGSAILGLKMNWVLELGGISIVAYGAHRRRISPQ